MSGKSPQGSSSKKHGKALKEKRAQKRAKSADAEFLPKRRKDGR